MVYANIASDLNYNLLRFFEYKGSFKKVTSIHSHFISFVYHTCLFVKVHANVEQKHCSSSITH